MLPTLTENDVILIRKALFKPVRGDVVVLMDPRRSEGEVLKRLIALEGDVVDIDPDEIPSSSRMHWLVYNDIIDGRFVQIPPGHCWIEGDNLESSMDSRYYGPIPTGMLKGKVTHVIWPFSLIRRIPSKPRDLPYISYYTTPHNKIPTNFPPPVHPSHPAPSTSPTELERIP